MIAGLAILAGLKRDGFMPRRTLKLFGLRGEESAWFGKAYMGSSALFGRLSPDDLASPQAVTGRSLADCMRDVGADVDRIVRGEPLIDSRQVAAWVELHIEQGPVLVARKLPIGIVTGIRGNVRHRVVAMHRRSRPFRRGAALAAPRRGVCDGRTDHPSRPALAHAA